MSNVKVIADKDDIVAIADAVRAKTGSIEEMSYSDIINEINGIESSGGVDTCTVNIITKSYSTQGEVACTIFTENGVSSLHQTVDAIGTITIDNVICGSVIYLLSPHGNYYYFNSDAILYRDVCDSVTNSRYAVMKIVASSGETVDIIHSPTNIVVP